MSNTTDRTEARLLTLPVEMLQQIGSKLDTPGELFNFACTCSRVYCAIDSLELHKKDVEFRMKLFYRGLIRGWPLQQVWDTLPHRALTWAVKNGAALEDIKRYIRIYEEDQDFAVGLGWRLHYGDETPMEAAISVGREDVVSVLMEHGVPRPRSPASDMDHMHDSDMDDDGMPPLSEPE
ncbi:hypothetical protein GGS26DRAFT_585781 [Hypomontagnella submonticulosa]|nr:hypothetical protein GGS26DRAFT_585781 [Hypomontagnella submonticulosa]